MDRRVFLLCLVLLLVVMSFIVVRRRRVYPQARFASLIVEPRSHEYLETVIRNVDQNTPRDWPMYIVHGRTNKAFVTSILSRLKSSRRFHLIGLKTDNLAPSEYNRLFLSLRFWSKIKADYVLVFQTDAILCKPVTSAMIRDMVRYGYMGCQTGSTDARPVWGGDSAHLPFGGVGGLSWRDNRFQKRCIKSLTPSQRRTMAEDVAFSMCQGKMQDQKASPIPKTLSKFCWQGNVPESLMDTPLGIHKPSLMSKQDVGKMARGCPAVRDILKET
jgi:hypothetical protein